MRVCVIEVRIVENFVQGRYILEWVGTLVHFSHVIVLKQIVEDVFRDVAQGILVLIKQRARIRSMVDVNLQMFTF